MSFGLKKIVHTLLTELPKTLQRKMKIIVHFHYGYANLR